jgi:tRNA(Ile)-lysidine synthase
MSLSINLPDGKYIVAVSGGVDSVVLLDLLSNVHRPTPNVQLIVAHFDHGIRDDSGKDAEFVKSLAKKYKLPFELGEGQLGPQASEAEARNKRYAFLKTVQQKHQASAIITAHHQDDVIETSIINILRGTGRRGLSSLKNRPGLLRPLLAFSKKQLIDYAKAHNLQWQEDTTNEDIKFLRNKIRQEIMPKMDDTARAKWLAILRQADIINEKLDTEINYLLRRGLHKGQLVLSRKWFTMLSHSIAKEVLLAIFYQMGALDMDRKTIERLSVQIKTLPGGKILQAPGITIELTKRNARFKSSQRGEKTV